MAKLPNLVEMLQAGVHFGHQTSRWHPKMKNFIFGSRGGIHIVDLEKTQQMLPDALAFVKSVAARGGNVLFVGTKRQAQPIVEKYAKACGMPYVTQRWLGGTLTNFATIRKSIARLKKLEEDVQRSQRLASLGEMAAGIAHELNSPLDGVLRYTHLALEHLTEDSPVREYLVHVKEGLDRMVRAVRAVFSDLAKFPIIGILITV